MRELINKYGIAALVVLLLASLMIVYIFRADRDYTLAQMKSKPDKYIKPEVTPVVMVEPIASPTPR